jgi:hypothetical protein
MAITDNHLRALGRITVELAWVEWFCGQVTGILIGDLDVGDIVTAHLSFKNKADLIYSLFKHKYGENSCPKLKSILNEIQTLVDARNGYIHSFWSEHPTQIDAAIRSKISARKSKGLQEEKESVSFQTLDKLADDFEQYGQRFSDFMGDVI